MASHWSWMGKRKEREVVGRLAEQMGKASEFVRRVASLVARPPSGREDVAEARRELGILEAESRHIKRDVMEELAKGMTDPLERAELARLALAIDGVVAHARVVFNRLEAASGMQPELRRMAANLASIANSAASILARAIARLEEDPAEVMLIAEKVEELEQQADEQASRAERLLAVLCGGRDAASCIAYYKLIDGLEDLVDSVEEVANRLRVLVIVKSYASG